MPPPDKFENAPLGTIFVSGYDAKSLSNPVLELHIDAKNPKMLVVPGQSLREFPAALGVACDVSDRYPNYILTDVEMYGADQRQKLTYRIVPTPWLYEFGFDPETLALVVTKKRENIGGNIKEYCSTFVGSGATGTASVSGGRVVSVGVTAGGSGYADYVNILFGAPNTTGVQAQGYGVCTGGQLTSIVVTQNGSGYTGAPTVSVLPFTTAEAKRQDTDSYLAIETVTLSSPGGVKVGSDIYQGWWDTESIGMNYEAIFNSAVGYNIIGWNMSFDAPARSFVVAAFSLFWFTQGEQTAPPSITALPNGGTIYSSSSGIINGLWNPTLTTLSSVMGFSLNNVITDYAEYSGTYVSGSVSISWDFDIPGSIPSRAVYEANLGNFVPYQFSSKRFKGDTYANKLTFIPLL